MKKEVQRHNRDSIKCRLHKWQVDIRRLLPKWLCLLILLEIQNSVIFRKEIKWSQLTWGQKRLHCPWDLTHLANMRKICSSWIMICRMMEGTFLLEIEFLGIYGLASDNWWRIQLPAICKDMLISPLVGIEQKWDLIGWIRHKIALSWGRPEE